MNGETVEEGGVPLLPLRFERGPGRRALSKAGEGGVRFFEESPAAQGFHGLFEKSLHGSPLAMRKLLQRTVGEIGDSDRGVGHDAVYGGYFGVYRNVYMLGKRIKVGQGAPAPRWAWNQSQVRRISSLRFSSFTRPWPSPAYTTSGGRPRGERRREEECPSHFQGRVELAKATSPRST